MGHTETDTRIHILEEAMPLFAAKGYNGVSMRHLARAVNLSSAALYHHFPDKHTLYLEVMKHSFVDKAHDIMRSGDEASEPVERFEAFIKRLTQVVTEDQIFRPGCRLTDDSGAGSQGTQYAHPQPERRRTGSDRPDAIDRHGLLVADLLPGRHNDR